MRHPRYIGSVEKSFIFCVLRLDKFPIPAIIMNVPAGVAHPVERHLAKVEVASSSLVTRSRSRTHLRSGFFICVRKNGGDRCRCCDRSSPLLLFGGTVTAGSFAETGKRPGGLDGRWNTGCKSLAFRPPRSFRRGDWPCGRRRWRGRGSDGR